MDRALRPVIAKVGVRFQESSLNFFRFFHIFIRTSKYESFHTFQKLKYLDKKGISSYMSPAIISLSPREV